MTSTTTLNQIERACADLARDGHPITIAAVTFVIGLLFVRETKDVDIYAGD